MEWKLYSDCLYQSCVEMQGVSTCKSNEQVVFFLLRGKWEMWDGVVGEPLVFFARSFSARTVTPPKNERLPSYYRATLF